MREDALTFVADEQHVVQQGLTLPEQAGRIAAAEGAYMFRTLAAVHAAGGSDPYLEQLAALVAAIQKSAADQRHPAAH